MTRTTRKEETERFAVYLIDLSGRLPSVPMGTIERPIGKPFAELDPEKIAKAQADADAVAALCGW